MIKEVIQKLHRADLRLDQTQVPLEFDDEEVQKFYIPLAKVITERASALQRYLVAVAGPPGSGKSAFALLLCAVVNICLGEENQAVLVGLDGWHFPNTYLESHFVERDGKRLPLRLLKGSPESFDAQGALSCLQAIRRRQEVFFPIYSRLLHDPLPNAGQVLAHHRVVIVEGNFLLLDEPPWNQFLTVFDSGIFIHASPEVCLAGLIERHRRGGKTEEEIQRQIQWVDLPNIYKIRSLSRGYEFWVEKKDPRHIQQINRRGEVFAV